MEVIIFIALLVGVVLNVRHDLGIMSKDIEEDDWILPYGIVIKNPEKFDKDNGE